MKARNRTLYRDLDDILNARSYQKSIKSDVLIELLKNRLSSEVFTYSKFTSALKIFRLYIEGKESLRVDEYLLSDFHTWVKGNRVTLRGTEVLQSSANLIEILNTFSGAVWLSHKILKGKTRQKYLFYCGLNQKSREMIVYFESNARQVKTNRLPYKNENGQIIVFKEFRLLKKKLAEIPKFGRIDLLISIMRKCGVDDISKITLEMLRSHSISEKVMKEVSYLFANLHQSGFLKSNPFCYFDFLSSLDENENVQYIEKEGIDRLLSYSYNIQNLGHDEAMTLAYCLLAYDSCLRAGELMGLTVEDIQEQGGVMSIRIRTEIQKGQNKSEKHIILLFEPVRAALRYFLKNFRAQINSSENWLFVSSRKVRPSQSTISKYIKKLADLIDLRIAGFPEKNITPHHFRRTFGTLNAPGLGLDLSLDELADRMRHEDPRTTRRHYIANNTYLEKMKFQKRRNAYSNRSSQKQKLQVGEFLDWLEDEVGFSKSLMLEIRTKVGLYQKSQEPGADLARFSMHECAALSIIEKLRIKPANFIKYCFENRKVIEVYSGVNLYDEEFVMDLSSHYIPVSEVIAKLYISKRTIYNNADFFSRITFGKAVFVDSRRVKRYKLHGLEGC